MSVFTQLHVLFIYPPSLVNTGHLHMGHKELPGTILLTKVVLLSTVAIVKRSSARSGALEAHTVYAGVFNRFGLVQIVHCLFWFWLLFLWQLGPWLWAIKWPHSTLQWLLALGAWVPSCQNAPIWGPLLPLSLLHLEERFVLAHPTNLLWFECPHQNSSLNVIFVLC